MHDADAWSRFLEFVSRAPAAPHPGVLFDGFRDELEARGASAEDAARQVALVVELARERDDWAAPMFDRIYTSDGALFRTEPSDFVVRMAAGRPGGTALDVAMGQGRNAVHLARAGWDVTGFDVSPAGLDAARAAAAEHGVAVDAVLASAASFDLGTAAWDLVVMTYALVPVTDATFADAVVRSLRPGGLVVIESFAVDGPAPRRPVDLDPEPLRAAYGDLVEIAFELDTAVAEWTLAPALVVRLAAERPT